MSVIQNIRDKYARVAVIAIALALLGFILMDAFTGRSNLFGGDNTTVGSVNGNKIEYVAFSRKIKAQEDMAQQQGYEINDATRQQIIESAWNDEINRTLLQREFEELGLAVGKKEMNDLLFGNNPPPDLKQGFTDPQTGAYNALGAQQYFNELKKNGTAEQKAQMNQYLESLEYQQMVGKYTSLISNSVYYAKWFLEKQNTDNSLIGRISYVAVPYASISDSAVKVTDNEIKEYIEDHKKEFEQKEETRSISYVTFSAAPTAADSAAVRNSMNNLKPEFNAAQDYEAFALTQGSPMGFYDGHISRENIKIPNKDSVLSAPVGTVYGPYVDGSSFVLSKILSAKQWPDTVNVRHILIATQQQGQGGQSMRIRDDSTAKRLADSLQAAIRGGANFDSMVVKFSDDPGSKDKGGLYENIPTGQMVASFNEFIFGNPTGSKGVVKTNYGYHYIEILSQKSSSPAYKIAYVSKPIVASPETDAEASNQANLFAGNSRDLKSFNTNYDKDLKNRGIPKLTTAEPIKPSDHSISGLGASRELVKAVFEADKGDVIEPIRVGDAYVVAAVTEVDEAGLASVNKARSSVEPILRNRKKAEQIKKKLGKISTFEAAASASGQPVQSVDSLRFNGERNPALGYELKVIGASFNTANQGKVVPEALEGQAGVYVLRVESIGSTPVQVGNLEDQRRTLQMQARQAVQYRPPTEALKKTADIEDNRARFF